jgi:hypothetical protein
MREGGQRQTKAYHTDRTETITILKWFRPHEVLQTELNGNYSIILYTPKQSLTPCSYLSRAEIVLSRSSFIFFLQCNELGKSTELAMLQRLQSPK